MHSNEKSGEVNLGCGAIIIITLVVIVFSGGGRIDELKKEVTGLREEVRALDRKVETLVEALRDPSREDVPAEAVPDPLQ